LNALQTEERIPHELWRDRLALAAAELSNRLSGRNESASGLRDAVHLTRHGDDPGPAGIVLHRWSRAVSRAISVASLHRTLGQGMHEQIVVSFKATEGPVVERASRVLEAALLDDARNEMEALLLADATLSRSLGWSFVTPVLGLSLTGREIRLRDEELRLACHRAIVRGVEKAVSVAADTSRRVVRLREVAPKLRARGATRAVELFMSRDAMPPSAFDFMSDRAARRLCDRLVELGAIRELTGRDSFRLYGV
jgi:hypothetical protein